MLRIPWRRALQLLQHRLNGSAAADSAIIAQQKLAAEADSAIGCGCLFAPCSSGTSPPAWCFASVRHMAGRTHKLSLKKHNNRASWAAAQPYVEQAALQQGSQQQQQLSKVQPIRTGIPELPKLEEPLHYRKIGRITGPYTITPQAAFGIVDTGGFQYKATADDVIYHPKIPGVLVNDVLELGKVLLVGTPQETIIGRPFIPGASIVAAVEETFKEAKVHVFKKKKRKRYQKLQGHRSHITALRVLELRCPVPLSSVKGSSTTGDTSSGTSGGNGSSKSAASRSAFGGTSSSMPG
eukprot:GHRR01008960.1.p1 GENE.GHRR01008960.1~~GHRR01008960.1.p1  ORF type:complete len:295 (+),score=104.38 GHRR01008960.1:1166-2050(+)